MYNPFLHHWEFFLLMYNLFFVFISLIVTIFLHNLVFYFSLLSNHIPLINMTLWTAFTTLLYVSFPYSHFNNPAGFNGHSHFGSHAADRQYCKTLRVSSVFDHLRHSRHFSHFRVGWDESDRPYNFDPLPLPFFFFERIKCVLTFSVSTFQGSFSLGVLVLELPSGCTLSSIVLLVTCFFYGIMECF